MSDMLHLLHGIVIVALGALIIAVIVRGLRR
jgi:hypothetical protein